MYLSILFFFAPADRWMDDNWSQDQEKTPEDNYLVKNQPFLEILKELHSLVFEFVEEFLNWILSVWFPKTFLHSNSSFATRTIITFCTMTCYLQFSA